MTPALKEAILRLVRTGNLLAQNPEVSEDAREEWNEAQESMLAEILGVDEEAQPVVPKGTPSPQSLQRKARTCVRIAELEGLTGKKVEQRAAQLMEFEDGALAEKEKFLRACSS